MPTHRFLRTISVVAAVFLLGADSAAGGEPPDIQVWFEAVGLNPASMVVQQGVKGGDLVIACEDLFGIDACEWDLSMKMDWDTGPVVTVIGSLATDFLGNTDKHAITDFLVGDYPLDGFLFDEVNEGGLLAITKGVQVPLVCEPTCEFDPIPPGEYTFLTARLTTLAAPGGDPADAIDMQINSLLWTFANDPAGPIHPDPLVQFGDADPLAGDVEGGLAEGVIVVLSVGDVNCDRAIDARDISSFSMAVLDPSGYAAMHPDCDGNLADVNGDGFSDPLDVEDFVYLLMDP